MLVVCRFVITSYSIHYTKLYEVNVNKAECYKPLDYARRKNLKETEKLLVKAGANTKDERQTCYDGNVFIEYNYKGSAFRVV